jgi:3-isopropylmalate/(R)-2-methylmalate dehydratase small subunit
MRPFARLTGIAASLPMSDIDTDKVVPGRFLKRMSRHGLGDALFHDLRFDADGRTFPGFVLNQAPWSRAQILVTGPNFGCGSAREHAPWALLDFGVRCLVAPSFADIFRTNCFKNGILPIALPREVIDRLSEAAARPRTAMLTVDLERQEIISGGESIAFAIEPARRRGLLSGLDEIARTLTHEDLIARHLAHRETEWPWLMTDMAAELNAP